MSKLRKSQLRHCAQVAARQRYIDVEEKTGRGIMPGGRLIGYPSEGSKPCQIAVRTSLDREVGLTRHPDGRWATVPRMDEVIVAVPSAWDSTQAEIFGFDPEVLIEAFDAALELQTSRYKQFSPKAPVFISLDMPRNPMRSADPTCDLSKKAKWRTLVPINTTDDRPRQTGDLFERARREFAERIGVDVSKVFVEFRVVA